MVLRVGLCAAAVAACCPRVRTHACMTQDTAEVDTAEVDTAEVDTAEVDMVYMEVADHTGWVVVGGRRERLKL